MSERHIVVVGAGVVGLTTALQLSKCANYRITVVAKHMPGDYDIEYASPWAGANYLPVASPDTAAADHERDTWPELARLAERHPEAGIHFQKAVRYDRKTDHQQASPGSWAASKYQSDSWVKDVVPNFRPLRQDELTTGYDSGITYTSVCLDTSVYLAWLKSQCLKNGVIFQRGILNHITQAAEMSQHQPHLDSKMKTRRKTDVIVNCTGLSARFLGGVEDSAVIPARGQTVLVRNEASEMCFNDITDDGEDEVCYVMQRAAGGGTILGGCYQKNNWSSQPDPNLAIRIMKRCIELCPSLTNGKGIEHLDIIRHGVGLRPLRTSGTRLEKEKMDGAGWVVHNYGHGGYGYQASYGCAKAAVKLVEEILAVKAKL